MTGIIFLLIKAIQIYQFIIIVRCLLSFIRPDPRNPIVAFIYQITDPLLQAVHRAFPILIQGGMDFSPIVILFLLEFTKNTIIRMLY